MNSCSVVFIRFRILEPVQEGAWHANCETWYNKKMPLQRMGLLQGEIFNGRGNHERSESNAGACQVYTAGFRPVCPGARSGADQPPGLGHSGPLPGLSAGTREIARDGGEVQPTHPELYPVSRGAESEPRACPKLAGGAEAGPEYPNGKRRDLGAQRTVPLAWAQRLHRMLLPLSGGTVPGGRAQSGAGGF